MTKLDNLMTYIQAKHVYIQTHNFPDPDAIASAYGLQQLLKHRGIRSSICYLGKIDRYSTNRMIEVLNIKINDVDTLSSLTEEDEIILVDAQKGNANIKDITGNEIICIDHHPTFEEITYRYQDVRPEIGACASIITEYFFENHIPIDENTATALLYGIKIDTANLTRGVSTLDLDMYYKLYPLSNAAILRELDSNNLQFDDLRAYANAINSIKVYDDISFANTGSNCPEPLIASISDFMLALIEVNFSVVYSLKKEGVKLSIRGNDYYDAGKITNLALKDLGNGGGHPSMAGGFVPYQGNARIDAMLLSTIESCFLNTIRQLYPLAE